jgi:hypothetical protein
MTQHLSTQVAQSSVSQHCDSLAIHGDLLWYAAGGGQWFHKDRCFRADAVGHGMQAGFGDQNGVCEGTVVVQDADDRAVRAMADQATAAGVAVVAGAVDLPDDSLPGELTGPCDTDKFMAEDSLESHVSLAQLQICFADTGLQDIHEDFVAAGIAERGVWCEVQSGVKNDSAHGSVPGCRS